MFIVGVIILTFLVTCIMTYGFLCYYHGGSVYCPSNDKMNGKTVLITGGSRGIGRETAVCLAKRGARVIIASRSKQSGEEAVRYIVDGSNNFNVKWLFVDLGDWSTVHALARTIIQTESNLHVLINNAAIPDSFGLQRFHGCDPVFAVNYLGHFLLTYLLLDLLKKSAPSRIINISSYSHNFIFQPLDFSLKDNCRITAPQEYSALEGYEISKFALALHVKDLARRLIGQGVTANYIHPGITKTNLWKRAFSEYPRYVKFLANILLRPMFVSAMVAAQTVVYCAVASELEGTSGLYFRKCRPAQQPFPVQDVKSSEKLWEISKLLTGCTDDGTVIQDLPRFIYEEENQRTVENFSVKHINSDPVKHEIERT